MNSCSSSSFRSGRTAHILSSRWSLVISQVVHMKIKAMVFLVALLVSGTDGAQSKLNVMASTEDLASIAREVGGDHITVESIAKGYQDPHFVEAKPSFILKLQKADLLILVGRDL